MLNYLPTSEFEVSCMNVEREGVLFLVGDNNMYRSLFV